MVLSKVAGTGLFAIVSAIAFATVLGTVSGLIVASSGAVVHDLMTTVFRVGLSEEEQDRCAAATLRQAELHGLVTGGGPHHGQHALAQPDVDGDLFLSFTAARS